MANDGQGGASSNGEEVAKIMRDQLKQMQLGLKEQIFRSIDILHKQIVENIRGGGLQRRTGALLNSMKKRVKQESGGWEGTISSEGVPYALIHEFGGVIKPKNAKNLVFPTEDNRNRDGSAKVSLAEVFKDRSHFFNNGVLMIEKRSAGKLERVKGKKGAEGPRNRGASEHRGYLPMFYFRKSVTIPARPYIRPALAAKRETIMKEFGVFLSLSFKEKE